MGGNPDLHNHFRWAHRLTLSANSHLTIDMKTMSRRAKTFHPVNYRFGIFGWSAKILVAGCLLAGNVVSSLASYKVKTEVESTAGCNHYTWIVQNQDQSRGLDQFVVDIPVQTHILTNTVPPPYSNPDGSAYWVMRQTREAQVDPHDGKVWLPAAQPGRKWIIWTGLQSPSVYPPGSAATFSLTTDDSLRPGVVRATATTYTPQNNPHYYFAFHGEVIGPSTISYDATNSKLTRASLQIMETRFHRAPFKDSSADSGQTASPASLSIRLYAGVTIDGVIGQTYGIEYCTDLNDPTAWRGLANVTLSATKQTWFDPQPALERQRYYRIVPGPISIP